jgi:hypothetical protein
MPFGTEIPIASSRKRKMESRKGEKAQSIYIRIVLCAFARELDNFVEGRRAGPWLSFLSIQVEFIVQLLFACPLKKPGQLILFPASVITLTGENQI